MVGPAKPVNLTASSHCRSSPKFTFGGKSPPKDLSTSLIGPGQYGQVSTDKSKHRRDPTFCFGGPVYKDKNREYAKTPGPGSYKQGSTLGSSVSSSFGSEKRFRMSGSMSVPGPGPGFYEVRGTAGQDEPSFSVRPKMKPLAGFGAEAPGPGKYQSQFGQITQANPRTVFSKSSRDELKSGVKNPGPGQYDLGSALMGTITLRAQPKFTMQGKYEQVRKGKDPDFISASSTFG
mmetsp:Transcript_60830/g.156797  ORF Transcript_60830/g.156797 Transcript_60830/m.156797 type:complete len:233 (-) Transcript_60830:92-790(-)